MKFSTAIIALTSSSAAIAAPAMHHRDFAAKRQEEVVTVTQWVDESGNVVLPANDAIQTGIVGEQGADVGNFAEGAAADADVTTTVYEPPVTTLVHTASSATAAATLVPKQRNEKEKQAVAAYSSNDLLDTSSNPDTEFQDGVIPCSQFPSGQGAIPVDWIGLGGWTSVMNMEGASGGYCQDGFYCSYACQPGMSKTQWPSEQPADGRSVGGLYCKDGYLYRSNKNSKYLCEWGMGTASAVNQLGQQVALCRTDYPGSENMDIPTVLQAGGSQPISVVNENSYYVWQGRDTTVQYYANNAGVSEQEGCTWGSAGSGVGNWAPLVLGAGYSDGVSYLSLIANPNNRSPANYNVKIVATDGSVVDGTCVYENGLFNGEDSSGCTVAVRSGSAQFVFY